MPSYPHAGFYEPQAFPSQRNRLTPGATVGIYEAGDGFVPVALYADRFRSVEMANPITLDEYGNSPGFYAAPGIYVARRIVNGVPATAYTVIEVEPDAADTVQETVLNVDSLGAAGDGTTYDDDAINEALELVSDNGGGKVLFTPGKTYRVAATGLNLSGLENVRLSGFGAEILSDTPTTSAHQVLSAVSCEDVVVEGLEFSCVSAPSEINGAYGVTFADCANVRVREIEVHTVAATGIVIDPGCADVKVLSSYVHDTQSDGCRVAGTTSDVVVQGNTFENTGDDAVSVVAAISGGSRVKGVTIVGNVIKDTTNGRGIAIVGGDGVTVVGNNIRDTDLSGIFVAEDSSFSTYASRNVTIMGNTLTNVNTTNAASHGGITIAGGLNSSDRQIRNVSVMGNTIDTVKGPALRSAGASSAGIRNVKFHGNLVSNVSGTNPAAVRASNTQTISIRGTQSEDVDGYGVYILSSCTGRITIAGNELYGLNRLNAAGVDGIHVEAATAADSIRIFDNQPVAYSGSTLDNDIECDAANSWIRRLASQRLYLTAGDLIALSGSPAATNSGGTGVTNRSAVMAFDPTTDEVAGTSFVVPQDWRSYEVAIWWGVASTVAGNVVWRYWSAEAASGASVNTPVVQSDVVSAAIASQSFTRTVVAPNVSCTHNRITRFSIMRVASDVLDTLSIDAMILGIEINRLT